MGIELFACKIRQARDIKGFTVPGSDSEIRITQYADDNTIFVSNKQSVKNVLTIAKNVTCMPCLALN